MAKDTGEKEAPESELAVLRMQHAYFPSMVNVVHLITFKMSCNGINLSAISRHERVLGIPLARYLLSH